MTIDELLALVDDHAIYCCTNGYTNYSKARATLHVALTEALGPETWTDDGGWTFEIEEPMQPVVKESLSTQSMQPVREPLTIAKLVDIALTASSGGLASRTSEWAAFVLQGIADRHVQPVREPLTDEQIDTLWFVDHDLINGHREFARAIEKAHGIGKST
jgi:hypothetical protein